MTRSEGVLVLAVVALAVLVLFGGFGVEVHRLFAEVTLDLQAVSGQ